MFKIFNYYADNGGIINGAIFLVAVVVLYIGTGKLLLLRKVTKKVTACKNGTDVSCHCIIHGVFFCDGQHSVEHYKNSFREKLLELVPRLESGLNTMATLIQVAPFLGLFGTVAGMIETFSLITTWGATNPVILTEGITVSLLTTQAGLLVAFPCMLFHNYLSTKKNELLQLILAEGESQLMHIEKHGEAS